MKKFLFILFLCSLGFADVLAQSETVVNEILFSISGESLTLRDRQIYQTVLVEVFQKKNISQFTAKTIDDFLLSRLYYNEAKTFGLKGVEYTVTENMMKKLLAEFSKAEISHELDVISKALALMEIKENQLKQKERFDSWFELIKRKYQVKIKSTETK